MLFLLHSEYQADKEKLDLFCSDEIETSKQAGFTVALNFTNTAN